MGSVPASYTVQVTVGPSSVDGINIPTSNHYYIKSTGKVGEGVNVITDSIGMLIALGNSSSFDTAIFAEDLILLENAETTVYGSGSRQPQPEDPSRGFTTGGGRRSGGGPSAGSAHIGTNSISTGAVVLQGDSLIDDGNGDILIGPGGNSSTVNAVSDTDYGSISPLAQTRTLDPVTLPFPSGGSDITYTSSRGQPLAEGVYGDVLVDGGTLRLLPNAVYQFKSLTVDNGGVLNLIAGAAPNLPDTEVYIEDKFEIKNGSVVNDRAKPENLRFYAADSAPVTLSESGTSATYVCYAPGSDVLVDNGAVIRGAVIGKNVTMKGNSPLDKARVEYDLSLQGLSLFGALGGGGSTGARVLHVQHF